MENAAGESRAAKRSKVRTTGQGNRTLSIVPEVPEPPEEKTVMAAMLNYPLDDIGNADRFVERFGERMRYLSDSERWAYCGEDLLWRVDSDHVIGVYGNMMDEVLETLDQAIAAQSANQIEDDPILKELLAIRRHTTQSRNEGRITSAVRVAARRRRSLLISSADLDGRADLLACADGVIELRRTGKVALREATPEDLISRAAAARFKSKDKNTHWENFLKTFMPNRAVRRWNQKLLGSKLLACNEMRHLVIVAGPTTSGKSTLGMLLHKTLGRYAGPFNLSLLKDNQEERPRADLVSVLELRMIIAEETSAEWDLHADQIKRFTGGTPAKARNPHSSRWVEMVPRCTPVIITNNPPTIKGRDEALDRRLAFVAMTESVVDHEDVTLKDKLLSSDMSAVLRWLIEGWELYCAEGLGEPPPEVVALAEEFKATLSPVDEWITECFDIDRDGDAFEMAVDVQDSYVSWCDKNRLKNRDRLDNGRLGRALVQRGHDKKKKSISGKKVWIRPGMLLREEARAEMKEWRSDQGISRWTPTEE